MTTKRQRGRPSKLNPQLNNKLLGLIRIGTPTETACRACGLDYVTVREWIRRGKGEHERSPTPEYVNFANGYETAVAEAEITLIAQIQKASNSDWKAAAWLLARRHPQRWAEPKPSSLEEIIVSMASSGLLSDEQLDALIKLSESSKNAAKEILSGEKIDNIINN